MGRLGGFEGEKGRTGGGRRVVNGFMVLRGLL